MKYERIEKAVFLERENRFVAYVELEGKREKVHVKNTGRCEELLIPGAEVYLQKSENEKRATLWDLIAVKKGWSIWIHRFRTGAWKNGCKPAICSKKSSVSVRR